MSDEATERTALKEWAVLCEAMARGEIMAMVRKGGVREQRAGFAVRHDRFLLYPTYFHEKRSELQPRFADRLQPQDPDRPPEGMIRIRHVARVSAVWHVLELDALRAIEAHHGLAWPAVVSRFEYRGRPEVRVVAVRVARLSRVHDVAETRRYQGCVSWVDLDGAIDVSSTEPVVTDAEHEAHMRALVGALGEPGTEP